MIFKPHNYQNTAIQHALSNTHSGLFMDMGLGKTSVTLSVVDELSYNACDIKNWLLVAPLKVAQETWKTEIAKWDNTKHISYSLVLGDAKERRKALLKKATLYIINRENLVWLIEHYGGDLPFDGLIIDELSSFKNPQAKRFKALKKIPFKRVIGLTGSPASNGLIDLWAELFLLDRGKRLGRTITAYREAFFVPGASNGRVVYKYICVKEREIYELIKDICISMRVRDYRNDLPQRIDRISWITFSDAMMRKYKDFERELIMELPEGEITAVHAAALAAKLTQFTNGAVYDVDRNVHELHDEKLDVLEENIEAAMEKPVIVFYSFKHDLARLKKRFPQGTDKLDVDKWNRGDIPLLFLHPMSAGHGLNLQHGGHIIEWFGLPRGLEFYEQAVARLDRQGQRDAVINTRILVRGTIDVIILKSLENKTSVQDAVLEAIKYEKTAITVCRTADI